MELERAIEVAKREWGNIRISLERCGDMGEFDLKSHINNRLTLVQIGSKYPTYHYLTEGSLLVRNLIETENKFSQHGYFTQEAAYVFGILAARAAERLGLIGELAQAFGNGYSWVRTGWFYPSSLENLFLMPQLLFFKIFFPLGGCFDWDFNSKVVKAKLGLVFYKFATWQDKPCTYAQDVRDYREQLEPLWHGLSLSLGFPRVNGSEEKHQKLERLEYPI